MDDCIVWTGAKAGNGYGVKFHNGRTEYVHRIAAEKAFGPIPSGMVVMHKCDNPACHNPSHLEIGTQRQNMADMRAKGRSAKGGRHWSKTNPSLVLRGEQVGTSKLTKEIVLAIRASYIKSPAGKASDTSLAAIARKFGIAFQTASKIINRKTWGHV